jgi:hypothetical protein
MRKLQYLAAALGLALFLTLGASTALAAKGAKRAEKTGDRHYRGVITAVDQDKDGKVNSFTVAIRHHKKKNKTGAKEMKFTLDSNTKFVAHGKMKTQFGASKLAKGERVRILAKGDHADKVVLKKAHARAKEVKKTPVREQARTR